MCGCVCVLGQIQGGAVAWMCTPFSVEHSMRVAARDFFFFSIPKASKNSSLPAPPCSSSISHLFCPPLLLSLAVPGTGVEVQSHSCPPQLDSPWSWTQPGSAAAMGRPLLPSQSPWCSLPVQEQGQGKGNYPLLLLFLVQPGSTFILASAG